ncbi:Ankyrin repeat-containing domain protein [Niveomyces insectorum RCEF 264]|uniref:Ankyrin repeat-containing domain protein n=1 Tax=Niveomyces insectorum RCEF 264 TaxID=1081102 RepID=A0A167PJ38_9HYPO|nr:Ankyrin repeat-containing domain protein [Niveomyces insectorum RCEF 264]
MSDEEDASPERGFDVISRDTVPIVEFPAGLSFEQRIVTLRQWLQPTEYLSPGNEYMKHLHAHVPGTGTWIYESDSFTEWARSTETGCLHLRGVAGSGKSVLAASTIRHLQESNPGTPVLFFFFRQIVEKNHSSKYLIRDFAAQLLPHSPVLMAEIEKLSKSRGVDGTEAAALWDILVQGLEAAPKVYCVVDALDEMDEEDFDIVHRLVAVADRRPNNFKIIFTNRPVPSIELALKGLRMLQARLEASFLYPDVATYVRVSMGTLEPLLRPEVEALVMQVICDRARGLFLHARLMTENLTEGLKDGRITEETLPDCLEVLPKTLEEVYEEMLREHSERSGVSRDQQATVLSCVIHASRPLRLIELGALIARLRGDDDLSEGKRLIRASCGRLLEILEDESVSVIHHSLTEFLSDQRRQQSPNAFPVLDAVHGHKMLANALLQYLDGCPLLDTNCDEPGDETYDKYDDYGDHDKERERRARVLQGVQLDHPLMTYAVNNLSHHIVKACEDDPDLFVSLDAYLVPGRPAFGIWMMQFWDSRLCGSFNMFHWAAFTGLAPYVAHLIARQPALLDARDGDGRTALSYAAELGNSEIVAVLLRAGADPRSDDRLGLTPLHHAASGNVGVVKLLLDAGVSPLIEKTKDTPYNVCHFHEHNRGETALEYAMRSRNVDIVTAVLTLIRSEDTNKCLHWAQDAESVEAVLRTGHATVDSFCGGKTLLFKAAALHDADTMRILLQYGADPNTRCKGSRFDYDDTVSLECYAPRGPTALHAFAGYDEGRKIYDEEGKRQAEACLRLLLEHGGDLSATTDGDTDGSNSRLDANFTPLHYAVQKKGSSLMGWDDGGDRTAELLSDMLLRAGADSNARTKQGGTPLFYVDTTCPDLIDVLSKYGADVNARALSGRTPLLRLIMEGNAWDAQLDSELFQRLIENGADVNAADRMGDTIFHQIFAVLDSFKEKDIPFLTTLVRAGADLNKRNNQGVVPLFKYCNKLVDERLIGFLIQSGLDIHVRNGNGETILWKIVAQYNAKLESLAQFVRLGADVTARANDGATLLHLAVRKGRSIEWLQFLVFAGVDPLASDADGNSLAHVAVKTANFQPAILERLTFLAKLGVSLAEPNAKGQTLLHIACGPSPEPDDEFSNSQDWVDVITTDPLFGTPDVDACDNQGATPLHSAASVSENTVRKLFQIGANPTSLTSEGISPLHIASRALQPGIVRVLLASYKRLGVLDQLVGLKDRKTGSGRTALHYACRSGCQDSVRVLLAHGASPTARDFLGLTPLHALAEFPQEDELWGPRTPGPCQRVRRGSNRPWNGFNDGVFEIIDSLHRAGADLNAKASDEAGSQITPADVATRTNFAQFLKKLSRVAGEPAESVTADAVEKEEFEKAVQSLLDISVPTGIPDKIADEVCNGRHEVIKAFGRRGGDLFALDRFGDETSLHVFALLGQARLLEHFSVEASRVDDEAEHRRRSNVKEEETSQKENHHDSGGPGTILGTACEREAPNLEVIRVLVETVGLDVNRLSHVRGFRYKLKKATPLHIVACGTRFWHVEALEYLLAHGADLEALNLDGETPLLVAVSSDHPSGFWKEETIRVLLCHGADPNTTSARSGLSALALSDHARVTRLLLEQGADIRRAHGALNRAAAKLDVDTVKLLLEAGADPNLASEADDRERTAKSSIRFPIHSAAIQSFDGESGWKPPDWDARQESTVKLLLAYGADPFAAYADGTHALQCIIEQHGLIGPMLNSRCFDSERRGKGGRTALLSACMPTPLAQNRPRSRADEPSRALHAEAALALLEGGARVHVTDDLGRTPLHWLCTMTQPLDECHKELVRKLVTRDSSCIHVKDNEGRKPIHLALRSHADWTTQHLLDHGACLTEPDPDGNIALHFLASRLVGETAAASAAAELFKKFLAMGLDVNTRNKKGETPVFVFMSTGWNGVQDRSPETSHSSQAADNAVFHCDALPVFIEAGADLFTTNDAGATLLHATAQRYIKDSHRNRDHVKDVVDAFERLLELGLDSKKEDAKMRTPIDIAVATNNKGIKDLFTDEGRRARQQFKRRKMGEATQER